MFSSLGLLKRFVPFLLTFGVGLLVASFFVPIFSTRYTVEKKGWKHGKCRDKDAEIQRLRDQIAVQEDELRIWRDSQVDWSAPEPPQFEGEIPMAYPPPPPPPVAPVAPVKRGR